MFFFIAERKSDRNRIAASICESSRWKEASRPAEETRLLVAFRMSAAFPDLYRTSSRDPRFL
jgi:plasmid stabilization system protein ParE